MIKFITHQQIDKAKWDECISSSLNGMLYGYSWYLDEASPNWNALVMDDYEAVFPLTHSNKYLIHYLYQPLFTQQLGLFYKNILGAEQLMDVIQAIPKKYRFIDINLNEANHVEEDQLPLVKRKNYLLDLEHPYPKLLKSYSDHTKRNLNKARKETLKIELVVPIEKVVEFYIKNKGRETLFVTSGDYKRFSRIVIATGRHCVVNTLSVCNEKNEMIASGIFALSNNRLTYLMGTANAEGRKKQAMFLLFDTLIQQYSEQPVTLDFEGSDIPGVARFFKGFGAKKQFYFKLKINRLPWFLRWMKG